MDNQKDVPYIAHESILARMERTIKRLWVLCIMLLIALVASNVGWLIYESQFEDTTTTEITQENDCGYNNFIGNNGDIYDGETND